MSETVRIKGWELTGLRRTGTVDLGSGVEVASTVRCDARRDGWGFVARVQLRNLQTGCLVERLELVADSSGIEPEDLRRVPLDELEAVVQDAAFPAENWKRFTRARHDDRVAAAATVYRLARILGNPPTRSVGESLGVSKATAGRLVRDARERGLLGPALGTVAGEG